MPYFEYPTNDTIVVLCRLDRVDVINIVVKVVVDLLYY